jgi:CubicO group peptidase (beta-lactamase class C family)
MKRRDFALAGLAFASQAGAVRAQTEPASGAASPAAPDLIGPILADTKAAALAGCVVTPDGLPWLAAQGVRRVGGEELVTPQDAWHLGSNTKAMTAAVYARLVELGQAKWGAVPADLFEGLRIDPAWASTPIEAFLTHRSGLSDKGLIDAAWLNAARTDPRALPVQRRALAARVLRAPPTGTPGQFEYANANYILAGAAIEKLAQSAWEDVIQQQLFGPLAMTSAGFGAPTGAAPWGHSADGKPVDPQGVADNPAALGPAGTVHASLEDYAKFVRLFLTDGADRLSPASVAKLSTPPDPAEDRGYALGWIVFRSRPWAKGPVLAHEGSNTLWHAVTIVGPKRGVAAIAVSNDEARGAKAAQRLAIGLVQQFAPA